MWERCWESFIIRLWYTFTSALITVNMLRIFHYSPLIYLHWAFRGFLRVENLSLFAFDILGLPQPWEQLGWESFIIRLWYTFPDAFIVLFLLRIFHYSPLIYFWGDIFLPKTVENLSLFAFDILSVKGIIADKCWESFIIRLWYTFGKRHNSGQMLRIFHYSPLIYFLRWCLRIVSVENLSLFAFDILKKMHRARKHGWESFIIRLWYTFR